MAWWKAGRKAKGSQEQDTCGTTTLRARVSRRDEVSERAVLLHLEPTDPATGLPAFTAGAHIDLHLRSGMVRQYSLVGDPATPSRYLVCVQREAEGRGGSQFVHESLHPGTVVEISPPRNTFALRTGATRVILLGGGIGVTPLVSMAEHLHRDGTPFEFHVYTRDRAALALADHVDDRPWAGSVHRHFSADGDSFRTGTPSALAEPVPGGAVYVCGPGDFIALAQARALSGGWDAEHVHVERFTGGIPLSSATAFDVVVASTGERVRVEDDASIADALEQRGYETYRSCGQGYCGSCVVGVRAGIPDHRDDFQSAAEHAANTRINVCVSRSLTPTLELDL